jgi:hypothetical protein
MSTGNQTAQAASLKSSKKRQRDTAETVASDGRKRPKVIAGEAYYYAPIDSKKGHIRLLTIQPGAFGSPLEVDLDKSYQLPRFRPIEQSDQEPKRLQKYLPLQFHALSYTWGSPADPVPLSVGGCGKHVIYITRNLDAALPYLRLRERERVIWIDAVCIDQLNLDERALQVQLMPDIYKAAEQVLCWVGSESANSSIAFDAIRQLDLKLDINLSNDMIKPRAKGDEDWANTSIALPFDGSVMHAVSDLFGRSWFERLWVYQEARLGGDRAVLQCGHVSIEWRKVVQANWIFRFKPWKEAVPPKLRERMGVVEQMYFPYRTNLALIIRRTCRMKCSDPRDRVYAMRSTTRQEEQDMPIDVDYKLPVGKVYQNYIQRYISHFNSLRLLPFCELQNHLLEMPTWVPDWSHLSSTNYPQAARYASGCMRANVLSISDESLEITGMHVGTIAQRTVVDIGRADEDDTIQAIKDSAPTGMLSSAHPGNTSMIEAFCCTLCFDVFRERKLPQRVRFPSFAHSLKFVEKILISDSDLSDLEPTETTKYLRYVADACKGRSIIKTCSGHMGLAPAICEPGDRIYVFPGCRELIAIRKHSSRPGYRVVGHAYIHGMSDGEPLFGQLPPHYSVVLRSEEGGLGCLRFRNSEDGTVEDQDPRFRDFSNEDLTEGLPGMGKAPKVEALRSRGVALETIMLV